MQNPTSAFAIDFEGFRAELPVGCVIERTKFEGKSVSAKMLSGGKDHVFIRANSKQGRMYSPFAEAGKQLHRIFADQVSTGDEEAALRFVQSYGFLGFDIPLEGEPTREDVSLIVGLARHFKKTIGKISDLQIQQSDQNKSRKKTQSRKTASSKGNWTADKNLGPIVAAFNEAVIPRVNVRMRTGVGDNAVAQIFFTPNSLASYMWLLLAHEVSGEWEYRSCTGCGAGFVINPKNGHQRNTRHCDDPSCRSRSSRHKKL